VADAEQEEREDREERGPVRFRTNALIARRLSSAATLLSRQEADPYRAMAYRQAARSIRRLDRDIAAIGEGGAKALMELKGVGPSIARAIAEQLLTGRWPFLDMLRGRLVPERLFISIPAIGPVLSRRIYDTLGITTLEALNAALREGRLGTVEGMGRRRIALVRATLAGILAQLQPRRPKPVWEEPSVAVLLDVDREYRARAEADELPRIAPQRFNPGGRAWQPIMHTSRGRWRVTALYSNTARAHELGLTRDWVVLYFHSNGGPEAQRTVVTETWGNLAGKRVVRGREEESHQFYAHQRHAAREGAAARTREVETVE
jgi:DNA polymerase (family 10)